MGVSEKMMFMEGEGGCGGEEFKGILELGSRGYGNNKVVEGISGWVSIKDKLIWR